MDFKSYLSGYVDGEGCFCVSISPSTRHRFGWEIRPSFSVSQNADRAQVLKMMRDYFNCGTIRPDRSDKTVKYEVRSVSDLVERVLPHFEEIPLMSGKQDDLEKFTCICHMMYQKLHLTETGFNQIVGLVFEMNPSGIRKYRRDEIKI